MALDAELLEKFERDWNDALANYEARTTAARMGNAQYDPASRTFAPQEVEPSVARGIQSELFGPLQSKWSLLAEGAGRRQQAEPRPQFFNTSAGVFMADPLSGATTKIVDVPVRAAAAKTTAPRISVGDRAILNSLGRNLADISAGLSNPGLSPASRMKQEAMRDAIAKQIADIESRYQSQEAPGQQWQVDPNTIPFGSPVTRNPAPPDTMEMFMGDPNNPVIQDEPPAPLPGGPSVRRSLRVLSIRPVEER